MKNSKGQFWSFDIIFAIVIFGIAIILLSFEWFNISNQFAISSGNWVSNLQFEAQSIRGRLLSTGSPSNWASVINSTDVSTWNGISIGIATENGTISMRRLMSFVAMSDYNYQATKQNLGVAFDYYVVLKSKTLNVSAGLNPGTNNATSIQVLKVPTEIDGESAQLEIMAWTNSTFGIN
jgi:hypothetical protein